MYVETELGISHKSKVSLPSISVTEMRLISQAIWMSMTRAKTVVFSVDGEVVGMAL